MAPPPVVNNGTHVKLNDGTLMPLVGLGCWQSSQEEVSNAVQCALKLGYCHIDTAYNYLNEEGVGDGIRKWGGKREDIYVTTKLPRIAMNGGQVERFLKLSLKKMGLQYVDLFLIHNPMGLKYIDDDTTFLSDPDNKLQQDFGTDLIAIWKEMEAVKALGLARSIGVSNFSSAQLRRLMAKSKVPPAVNQVEMHVEFQQREMHEYCNEAGILMAAYGALGSPGRTSEESRFGMTLPVLLQNPVVKLIAENHKVSTAQVLIKFWVQQGVACMAKSVNPKRIESNFKVFDWRMTDTEMAALKFLDRGEAGRTFVFLRKKGCHLHPECPIAVEGQVGEHWREL